MGRQIVANYKNLMKTGIAVGVTLGLVLLMFERIRFWFSLVSVLAAIRFISIKISGCFLLPFFMGRKRIGSRDKAVLITGCDTGFGNLLAKQLDKLGFHVFAGCLYPLENGGRDLIETCSANVKVFQLDVSDLKSVEEAKQFVETNLGDLELWAVVNNAGVSREALFEITSMKTVEQTINVNLMGVVRVTKTFLPLIRKAKGRIVNVASMAGRLCMPAAMCYSTSKHAVITFSDTLRMEMNRFGVSVVTIEPWFYKTRMTEYNSIAKFLDKEWEAASADIQAAYPKDRLKRMQEGIRSTLPYLTLDDPGEVVDAMVRAITEEVPQYSYQPSRWYHRLLLWFLTQAEPEPIKDILIIKYAFRNPFSSKKQA